MKTSINPFHSSFGGLSKATSTVKVSVHYKHCKDLSTKKMEAYHQRQGCRSSISDTSNRVAPAWVASEFTWPRDSRMRHFNSFHFWSRLVFFSRASHRKVSILRNGLPHNGDHLKGHQIGEIHRWNFPAKNEVSWSCRSRPTCGNPQMQDVVHQPWYQPQGQMVGHKGNVSQIPSNSLSTRTTTTSPSIKLKAFAYCSSKDTQFSPERSPVHRIWVILLHTTYRWIIYGSWWVCFQFVEASRIQEVHETSNIVLVGSEQDSAILDPELRHAGLPSVGKS